jgi:inward rectifier potassium channel
MKLQSQKLRSKLTRTRRNIVQIKLLDGQFHLPGGGAWYSYWRDPYHMMLTISWKGFLALIIGAYLGINALFALIYLVGGNNIVNAQPGSFLDAFFFSVQTFASIGYGVMSPQTLYANIVVTIEAMLGIVSIAVMTGLAFARFSRPSARVMFSRVAVITPHDGQPTLIFRTANQRRNQILEAQLRVYLLRDEVTLEGQHIRRIHDLELLRNRTPNFSLTWVVMHPINASSPLYGMTAENLQQAKAMIVISISGLDETVAQVVHARHTYAAQEVLWNHKFIDIVHLSEDGHRYIDYDFFHEVVPFDA